MGNPKDDMFDKLVQNAFDFMRRALKLIEDDPKVSIIFFWTGLELFVKARLMKEHWSLILTNPKDADLNEFQAGDFQSVSFKDATKRLKKISGLTLSGSKKKCFTVLKDHRNKLVHFFSADYTPPVNASLVETAVIEQCRAWFYLHLWLTADWTAEFSDYQDEVEKIHALIKRKRKFLQARYDELKPKINKLKAKGNVFGECITCDFPAALENSVITQSGLEVLKQKCFVCSSSRTLLRIQCPQCQLSIDVDELGEGACMNCGKEIEMAELKGVLGPSRTTKDDLIDSPYAYCSDCEYTSESTVIPLKCGSHLCLSCITVHDSISECECCGEMITGDAIGTHWDGCVVCAGEYVFD